VFENFSCFPFQAYPHLFDVLLFLTIVFLDDFDSWVWGRPLPIRFSECFFFPHDRDTGVLMGKPVLLNTSFPVRSQDHCADCRCCSLFYCRPLDLTHRPPLQGGFWRCERISCLFVCCSFRNLVLLPWVFLVHRYVSSPHPS